MGDRGNIVIRQDKTNLGDVWFYSHWTGTELPSVVHKALARRERWDDPSYLARIVFCELVKGNEDGDTGFGISTEIGDNEHDIIVVDQPNQLVCVVDPEHTAEDGKLSSKLVCKQEWTFVEYIKLKTSKLPSI